MLTQLSDLHAAMIRRFEDWYSVPEQHADWITLERKDQAHLSVQLYKGRFLIKAYSCFPNAHNFLPYQVHFPEITCAQSRPVIRILSEIERRVLVPFEPLHRQVLDRKGLDDAYCLKSLINAQRLGKILDDEPRPQNNDHDYEVSSYFPNEAYARVRVTGDRIKLEIDSVSIGQAEAILRIVQGLQPFPS